MIGYFVITLYLAILVAIMVQSGLKNLISVVTYLPGIYSYTCLIPTATYLKVKPLASYLTVTSYTLYTSTAYSYTLWIAIARLIMS